MDTLQYLQQEPLTSCSKTPNRKDNRNDRTPKKSEVKEKRFIILLFCSLVVNIICIALICERLTGVHLQTKRNATVEYLQLNVSCFCCHGKCHEAWISPPKGTNDSHQSPELQSIEAPFGVAELMKMVSFFGGRCRSNIVVVCFFRGWGWGGGWSESFVNFAHHSQEARNMFYNKISVKLCIHYTFLQCMTFIPNGLQTSSTYNYTYSL